MIDGSVVTGFSIVFDAVKPFQVVQYSTDNIHYLSLCIPKAGLLLTVDQGLLSLSNSDTPVFHRFSLTVMLGCRYMAYFKGHLHGGTLIQLGDLLGFLPVFHTQSFRRVSTALCLAALIQTILLGLGEPQAHALPVPLAPPIPKGSHSGGNGDNSYGESDSSVRAGNVLGTEMISKSSGAKAANILELSGQNEVRFNPGQFVVTSGYAVGKSGNVFTLNDVESIHVDDRIMLFLGQNHLIRISVDSDLKHQIDDYKFVADELGVSHDKTIALRLKLAYRLYSQMVNTGEIKSGEKVVLNGKSVRLANSESDDEVAYLFSALEFKEDAL